MSRKSIAQAGLTALEWRILAYLDQQGATDRSKMVRDLVSPDSRIARFGNGSNSFIPAHAANWTRRLVSEGLVTMRMERSFDELPRQYVITPAGRALLRSADQAKVEK